MSTEVQDETTSSTNSVPHLPPDSPGSSVSSRMQDEYDELLKYAIVVPNYDSGKFVHNFQSLRGAFEQNLLEQQADSHQQQEQSEDGSSSVGDNEEEEEESETTEQTNESEATSQSNPDRATPQSGKFYDAVHSREVDKFMSTQLFKGPLLSETDSVGEMKLSQKMQALEDVASVHGSEFSENPVSPSVGLSSGIDPDITRMETLMEQWLGDLKRNVLAEFSHSRIRQMEGSKQYFQREREKHAHEMTSLRNEMESMKELLHTYEQSIERKDEVITNLTRAMQKQKDKFEMLKTFCEWKIKHNDTKREAFASNLAKKHYHRHIQRKAWDAWHSIIENKWRQRVEKACQTKAQEVCMGLTNDYEAKISSLNEALSSSRTEVSRLHDERERYEETMKKAFMRGVCALNMEAMTMFHEADKKDERSPEEVVSERIIPEATQSGVHPLNFLTEQAPVPDIIGAPMAVSHDAMFTTGPPGAPAPRVVLTQPSNASQATLAASSSSKVSTKLKSQTSKGKILTAKVTGRTDSRRVVPSGSLGSGNVTLAPPMSSVMVERHQPVTKQTIGQATAMRYPKNGVTPSQQQVGSQSSIIQRKVAGQVGGVQLVNSTASVQTIKVVE